MSVTSPTRTATCSMAPTRQHSSSQWGRRVARGWSESTSVGTGFTSRTLSLSAAASRVPTI